jgi:glutamine amidotransferase
MCRLFGAIGSGPVAYDLFEEFAGLAVTGNTPRGGPDERGHQDGWGLAFFHNGKLEQHARGPGSAQGDPKYAQAAWRIARVNAERRAGEWLAVVGHIRRASEGMPVGTEWAHPFVESKDGRTWAFAHNGGIDGFPFRRDEGLIDSQALFRELLANLAGDGPEAVAAATKAVVDWARREHGGYSAVNFVLSDGERLHAFREYTEKPEYYTLCCDDFGEQVLVCSQPILGMREEPVVKGYLVSIGRDLKTTRLRVL